ncbi:MAG: phosphate ABC transporter substrate-binding protein PstS [Pseudomonadota bacterium]|nr:phosphate ABC transporter substrate-binding protein PstS [Pseudomonadota bacterium]
MSFSPRILTAALGLSAALWAFSAQAADITGAGATFPYPIYAKWAEMYKAKTGVGLNYQSIGSGGGIKQIKAKTVDFGASDKPLTPEELAKDNLFQFPMVVGGVVPTVNVEGIKPGQLKLTGVLLADIYLGKIKKWNDGAIAALNPGVALPAKDIVPVSRSDGSGTTFIFTNYLSKVSPEWKGAVGNDASVKWPTGISMKGNEGVASSVKQTPNSIGYIEYAYVIQNKMTYVAMKNKDGGFVEPNDKSFGAAAAGADWVHAPGFYEILTDEPGKDSWPITGATFILMQKVQDKPETGKQVLEFFDWAYHSGAKSALELDYIPLPESVAKLVEGEWKSNIKDAAGKPVF